MDIWREHCLLTVLFDSIAGIVLNYLKCPRAILDKDFWPMLVYAVVGFDDRSQGKVVIDDVHRVDYHLKNYEHQHDEGIAEQRQQPLDSDSIIAAVDVNDADGLAVAVIKHFGQDDACHCLEEHY